MREMVLQGTYIAVSTIFLILLCEWTYHWMVSSKKKILIGSAVLIIVLIFYAVNYKHLWSFPIYFCTEIAVIMYLSEWQRKGKLLRILCVSFTSGLVEILFQFLSKILIVGLSDQHYQLISILLTLLFLTAVKKTNGFTTFSQAMIHLSWKKQLLLMLLSITCSLLQLLGQEGILQFESHNIAVIFQVFAITNLLIVIIVLTTFVYENNQRIQLEEVLQIRQDYYRALYEKDQEMRSFRHDIASHMGVLSLLLEQEKGAEAKNYLGSIIGDLEKTRMEHVHVGDELMDALLTLMAQRAKAQGVVLEICGAMEQERKEISYELCTIFSNAIQNAIEGCQAAKEDRKVTVKILDHQNTLMVSIMNPSTYEQFLSLQKEQTSKADADNHGYGVRKIKAVVKQINGTLEYSFKDGQVILDVYI